MQVTGFTQRLFVILALASAGIGTGRAAIIYQALPDQSGAADMNCCVEADSFILASATTIQQITFWSAQTTDTDYANSIEWTFLSDLAGTPGASLASGSATPVGVSTATAVGSLNEFVYVFPVNVNLNGGTYWLQLHNGPSSTAPATDFYWEYNNGSAGNSMYMDINGSEWLGNSASLAFQLDGTPTTPSEAPEPSSFVLMGASLVAIQCVRSRKKA